MEIVYSIIYPFPNFKLSKVATKITKLSWSILRLPKESPWSVHINDINLQMEE